MDWQRGEFGRPARPVAGEATRRRRRRLGSPTTSVAQLVEHRSPKPAVGGSIPSARAVRSLRSLGVSWSVGKRLGTEHGKPKHGSQATESATKFQQVREVPWAKSKTKCRRRNPPSRARESPAATPRVFRLVPCQPGPCRSLQAHAGVVRPGLHGFGPGIDRGRRGLEGLRCVDRVLAGLAVWLAGGLRWRSWAGSSSGSFISPRSRSF